VHPHLVGAVAAHQRFHDVGADIAHLASVGARHQALRLLDGTWNRTSLVLIGALRALGRPPGEAEAA
jgi:hypothetical protein